MKIRTTIMILGICAVLGWPASILAEPQHASSAQPVVQTFDWLPGGQEELSRVNPGQEPPGQEPYYVTMQVKFECLLFDGDCSQFQILKPPAAQAVPWHTVGGCSIEDAFAGEPIRDGVFTLRPGELTLIKVAYFNNTDKPVKFRGTPHYIEPQNLQPVTVMNCMCLGETYTVPPHSGWFRIIRLGPAFDTPNGARVVATHVLTSDSLVD